VGRLNQTTIDPRIFALWHLGHCANNRPHASPRQPLRSSSPMHAAGLDSARGNPTQNSDRLALFRTQRASSGSGACRFTRSAGFLMRTAVVLRPRGGDNSPPLLLSSEIDQLRLSSSGGAASAVSSKAPATSLDSLTIDSRFLVQSCRSKSSTVTSPPSWCES
jgi:hypothetical protein